MSVPQIRNLYPQYYGIYLIYSYRASPSSSRTFGSVGCNNCADRSAAAAITREMCARRCPKVILPTEGVSLNGPIRRGGGGGENELIRRLW